MGTTPLQLKGEVGKRGVAIDSLEDMEILFSGHLEKTTGVDPRSHDLPGKRALGHVPCRRGTAGRGLEEASPFTAKRHPEGIYRPETNKIHPPAPSMRLVVDTFEFGSLFTPRFNPISISGFSLAEAGANALQDLLHHL